MMLPDHLQPVAMLRAAGIPVHLAERRAAVPPRGEGPALLVIGDDRLRTEARGPAGFDCANLRAWLAALRPGAIGVFAGAPDPASYAALCEATVCLPGGAVLVECTPGHYAAWSAFVDEHAPAAARFSVVPAGHPAAEGGTRLMLEPITEGRA